MKTSVLQIRGLTALRKRTSHTHMACEDFFQILVGALCGCDLLPSPDEGISASYLVTSLMPSAWEGAMRPHHSPKPGDSSEANGGQREKGRTHATHPKQDGRHMHEPKTLTMFLRAHRRVLAYSKPITLLPALNFCPSLQLAHRTRSTQELQERGRSKPKDQSSSAERS